MKNASSNILRINKNVVIYFGLLLLQSTHPVSHTDSIARRRKKKRLGKLPVPCAFPSDSPTCTAQPTSSIISRGFHSEFQLKVSLSCSNTLSLACSSSGARVGELMQPAARPCRACCIARPSAQCRWCSSRSRSLAHSPQSIHSLCIQYTCSFQSAILQISLRRRAKYEIQSDANICHREICR